MPVVPHDIEYYLKAAGELAACVATDADRIEQDRQLPAKLVGDLADRGFFRLLLPRSLGGAELDLLDFLRVLQVFAEADASTAWCINQNNVLATDSAIMPEETARAIWSDGRAVVANAPPTSPGTAFAVAGGYRLGGHWNFSSGCTHATWIAAPASIRRRGQTDDRSTPGEDRRVMLIPKDSVTFVDRWQVNGLRGTGSFSFEVDDLYVPSARTFSQTDPPREDGPLYTIPKGLLFGAGFATVALGVARASLRPAMELARTKTPERAQKVLQDETTTHRLIGEAEAIWRSARAFLDESASSVWESACKNRTLTTEQRIGLRLAVTHAIRKAAEVVDTSYSLCGSDAIFATNPVQRHFQDIHVITQHSQARPTHFETAGQFLLGLEPEGIV